MPIGLNVDNPQSQTSLASVTPTNTVSFGGNVIGAGTGGGASASAATTPSISMILIYGAIGLVVVFILKKLGS